MPKKALTEKERRLHPSAHGGILRRRRRGRGQRTLSTRYSMHLVLRAMWAYGVFSFATPENRYLKINDLEGRGHTREVARLLVQKSHDGC